MKEDQVDLGLNRVAQKIQKSRNGYGGGSALIQQSSLELNSLPTDEAELITAVGDLVSDGGINDDRKARLAQYVSIFQALRTPINTTVGNLEDITGL